jgi:hypothetical protein
MALVAVDLVESFFKFQPSAFEFDLDEGQAVNQQGYVVAVFVIALLGNLVGDLVLVSAPVFSIKEFQVKGGTVIAAHFHFVAQAFGAIEDVAFVEVIENSFEFFVAELNVVMLLKLGFEVGIEFCGTANGDGFIA